MSHPATADSHRSETCPSSAAVCCEIRREELDRHAPLMRWRISRLLQKAMPYHPHDWVEDLLQETYCHLLSDAERRLRVHLNYGPEGIPGYLAAVAEGVTRDRLRREWADKRGGGRTISCGLRVPFDPEAPEAANTCPEQRLLAREGFHQLLTGLARLAPKAERRRRVAVILMAGVMELSYPEIARHQELKLSSGAVNSLLHRTRRDARKAFPELARTAEPRARAPLTATPETTISGNEGTD
ncbi:MAG: sigma-70 family RNA polymerase sigma factor [Thermoanaerobaculia bacterium]